MMIFTDRLMFDKIDMCLTNIKLILSIKCIKGLNIFILILFKI